MKYYELDKEEQELLDAVERGEFVPIKNETKVREEIIAAAKEAGNKTRNINIRLTSRVVHKLKARAAQEGIPYQTLAASILHKNVQ